MEISRASLEEQWGKDEAYSEKAGLIIDIFLAAVAIESKVQAAGLGTTPRLKFDDFMAAVRLFDAIQRDQDALVGPLYKNFEKLQAKHSS